jgi:hypothetical protein
MPDPSRAPAPVDSDLWTEREAATDRATALTADLFASGCVLADLMLELRRGAPGRPRPRAVAGNGDSPTDWPTGGATRSA